MRTEIATLGEFGLIDRLTEGIKPENESTKYGVGDDAAVLGGDIPVFLVVALGLQQIVQGQLGGLDVELELLDVVLHAAGVDAEEHIPLVDGLPLLKGGLQDLAADQAGHPVGADGLDGAGAGDRDRHVPHLGGVGQIDGAEGLLPSWNALAP